MQFVDLKGQYDKIKPEVDAAVAEVLAGTSFIKGPQVALFEEHLGSFTGAKYVIGCANGTDALQIALMALGLRPGDEVIVPAFTYVASAEVIALLGLVPVMVDVDERTFNISPETLEQALSPRTKAIIPVHLYGQCAPMEEILAFAEAHDLKVIEDTAQALGAEYRFSNGRTAQAGTMGDIGCTSFFPTKNLGCYGDGGAIFTSDAELAERIRMIANHGQRVKYHHSLIGCNSRLDTLQAAILDVKLKYLNEYLQARKRAAAFYDRALAGLTKESASKCGRNLSIQLPFRAPYSTHTFHQYTIVVKPAAGEEEISIYALAARRDALKVSLAKAGIPSMVYYPLPLQEQEAFRGVARISGSLERSAGLAASVLSLPMHTELTESIQNQVVDACKSFFEK